MTKTSAMSYYIASSRNRGPLSIFHIHGPEATLSGALDAAIGRRNGEEKNNPLRANELRYGLLRAGDGEAVDEVLLAKVADGGRILMVHGGGGILRAVSRFLGECGFDEITNETTAADWVADPVLAECVTEAQVAAVLKARAAGGAGEVPERLLAVHRLVVAGPPNAGKSSLLNHLAGYGRAFVHPEAGATRDVVDELVDLGGYAVLVGDLPGHAAGFVGVDAVAWGKARERLRLTGSVLMVYDGSVAWGVGDAEATREVAGVLREGVRVLVVLNKADLPRRLEGEPWRGVFPDAPVASVCSLEDGDALDVISGYAGWLFGE